MSLLPETIVPYSHPLGKANELGQVFIDKNWWLFLYNVAQNVLGTNEGLPASALTELASSDADIASGDAAALRRPIDNASIQALFAQDLAPTSADLPDIGRALLLAQDPLLQDPPSTAQPVQAITVGASPFSFPASFNGNVTVTGGTVSLITINRQGTVVATGLITGIIPLSRGDVVQVTYTVAPTMKFLPL